MATSNIIVISEKDQEKKARMTVIIISVHHNIRSPSQGFRLEMETKGFHLERKKWNYVCSQGHGFMYRKIFKSTHTKILHQKLHSTKSTFKYLSMHEEWPFHKGN